MFKPNDRIVAVYSPRSGEHGTVMELISGTDYAIVSFDGDDDNTSIDLRYLKLSEEQPPEIGGAKKFNKGKTRISILPLLAIKEVKKVAEMGAVKYGAHNYRDGRPVCDWLDAGYRHAFDEFLGEGIDLDPESKIHHLAHAAWNMLVALEQMLTKPELDDRYKVSTSNNANGSNRKQEN